MLLTAEQRNTLSALITQHSFIALHAGPTGQLSIKKRCHVTRGRPFKRLGETSQLDSSADLLPPPPVPRITEDTNPVGERSLLFFTLFIPICFSFKCSSDLFSPDMKSLQCPATVLLLATILLLASQTTSSLSMDRMQKQRTPATGSMSQVSNQLLQIYSNTSKISF